jgi:hypothetical protein
VPCRVGLKAKRLERKKIRRGVRTDLNHANLADDPSIPIDERGTNDDTIHVSRCYRIEMIVLESKKVGEGCSLLVLCEQKLQ